MVLLASGVAALVVSLLVGWLIVRFEHLHAWASHDALDSGPQKFHSRATPRIGGVPVAVGMGAGLWLSSAMGGAPAGELALFALSVLPAFLSGLIEDLTKRVGPDMRLWASFLSALICVYFFDLVIGRLDFPLVDSVLAWYPLALAFTVVAVGGVPHAINIIDGYNGLAGGSVVLMLVAIGFVAGTVGDSLVVAICFALGGATLGLLAWNWPRGMIFAGDGGAYLWGVTLGITAVLLVQRNPEVSPWFPLVVVFYPVWETLFTIWRRKFKHSAPSGLPDAKHLHQLIYRRLLRLPASAGKGGGADPRLCRNSSTSPFLWVLAAIAILPALFAWRHTGWLVTCAILFALLYGWLYHVIVCFRVPRWLHSLGRQVGGLCVRPSR